MKMEDKDKSKLEDSTNNDAVLMPLEESLLGSVTTFSTHEGPEVKGQQIRSSARVYKKLKLSQSVLLPVEKSEKKEDNKQDTKKCYRPLWTSDDKTIFFEALNEFGKDFDKIHGYISTKLRKKGVSDHLIKTKDQIRHLYYRSWNKISKYVKFADGIKKVVQELYGLINYGELRKKIGSVNERSLLKLNELMYTGITGIKSKGKMIRVKTPMCRALRRLNQLDEKYDEIRLPNRITVELQPKDMTSFLRVQSIAQNPRIRTALPLQKRLSTLISCINKKWKSLDAAFYDKALISVSPVTNACVPSAKEAEENKMILNPSLRLTPPVGRHIEIPSINLSEYFTTQSICLNSYEHRVGITNNDYTSRNYSMFKLMNKNSSRKTSRTRADSISDKSPQKNNSNTDENELCEMTDNEPNVDNKLPEEPVKIEFVNVQPDLLINIKQEKIDVDEELLRIEKDKQNEIDEQKQKRIENIKKGWTLKDSESLTLGEIYLMFGSETKLVLEYSWDELKAIKSENDEQEVKMDVSTNGNIDQPDTATNKLNLTDSLTKLLSVAKLHYRKNVIACPCGHVCGTKNNAQLKKAVECKIRKILTDFDKCTDEGDDKTTEQNGRTILPSSVYLAPKVRPISPATYYHQPNHILVSQIDSIRRLKPRYCNRRGRRPRSKQVVVERKLPLLPNRVENDHQIVRMNIISQQPAKIPNFGDQLNVTRGIVNHTDPCNTFITQDQALSSNPVFLQEHQCSSDLISKVDNDITLEFATDSMIPTAPSSPSRILKESDNQWINSEVADYSLSSLLGHLESPVKGSSSSNLTNDDSRLSQDMGAQILSLLTESSVDFSANFADLAAEVASEVKK